MATETLPPGFTEVFAFEPSAKARFAVNISLTNTLHYSFKNKGVNAATGLPWYPGTNIVMQGGNGNSLAQHPLFVFNSGASTEIRKEELR